jgi:hypothetical protein
LLDEDERLEKLEKEFKKKKRKKRWLFRYGFN